MPFSFDKVRVRKRKRPAKAARLSHNAVDLAKAVMEIAKVIDPEAFTPSSGMFGLAISVQRAMQGFHVELMQQRQHVAMQKAREAIAICDHVLGRRLIINRNGSVLTMKS